MDLNADAYCRPVSSAEQCIAKGGCVSELGFDNKRLFFQLGAREHYALPRAFQAHGTLAALFTDTWIDPRSSYCAALGRLSSRLVARFEPSLKDARVEHFTNSLIWFEARRALLGKRRTNSCGFFAFFPRSECDEEKRVIGRAHRTQQTKTDDGRGVLNSRRLS